MFKLTLVLNSVDISYIQMSLPSSVNASKTPTPTSLSGAVNATPASSVMTSSMVSTEGTAGGPTTILSSTERS